MVIDFFILFICLEINRNMEIFRGQNFLQFVERFKTDEDCIIYFSEIKRENVYICLKCGHTKYQEYGKHSHLCNYCI